MNRPPQSRNHFVSAVVIACGAWHGTFAAPDGGAQAHRVIRPVNIAHNEQGDVAPMSSPRNGCRQGSPWFSGIGHLEFGFASHAIGISPDGQIVVGSSTGYDLASGSGAYQHAVAWNACNGLRTVPGTPQTASSSTAYSISNTGHHVAGVVTMDFEKGGMWLNRTDGIDALVNPELGYQQQTAVRGVTADGSAFAGTATDINGSEAFMFVLGLPQATMLGDLPGGEARSEAAAISHHGNAVVGWSSSASGPEAFYWRSGPGMVGIGDLVGGAFDSRATAVNEDGTVVVGSGTTEQGRQAFRWTSAGGMVGLGDLPGGYEFSEALAVSADGNVIVGVSSTDYGDEAFIWTPEDGMRSLNAIAHNRLANQLAGWHLISARGISADGMVMVGSAFNPSGFEEGWVLELAVTCRADWDQDGTLNSSDMFSFLQAFFVGDADFSGDNVTNTQDFFEFLQAFFGGC